MLKNGTRPASPHVESLTHELLRLARRPCDLKTLFKQDTERAKRYSINACNLFYDYSKNLFDESSVNYLIQWANSQSLAQRIESLFNGEEINLSENKVACYPSLRAGIHETDTPFYDNIMTARQDMLDWAELCHQGKIRGATNQILTTIVNIGIGGSDLGPKMACQALGFYHHSDLNIYFVSNGDPTALHRLLPQLNPHTTLFILSSKSFQTKETQFNIEASFKWLSKRLPNLELSAHFVAVTAHIERVAQLPFKVRHTFMIEDWVGGRFSIWSSIGLPLAIMIGKAHFKAFLNGARNMDHHFRNTPFFNNMPVMMALMSVWYVSFKHMQHHAIIPYQHLLRSFPNYLQQLEMESNGKSLTFSNQVSALATCPVIWGGVGSNSQHAFHQYLHQGMHWGPIDFIMVAKSPTVQNEQYRYLLAQCVSQAEVLMKGHDEPGSHYLAGNRPSSMLILAELSPENLGALIALYEHKIYVQSALWNINAFDQPGVEQGKRNADENDARLIQGYADEFQDGSTQQLLNQLINWF